MIRIITICCAFICCLSTIGQVGINTTFPSDAAVLHISSSSDNMNFGGLMLPKVDATGKANIVAKAVASDEGLLIYDTVTRCIQIWNGTDLQFQNVYCMPVAPSSLLTETFETDGNGSRYTTSTPEFTDAISDFFIRTDGANISGTYSVLMPEGSFWFAAQDLDGEGAASTQSITFNAVNISSISTLQLALLIAEDDDGVNEDWDDNDSLIVEYSIDGGGYTQFFGVEGAGGINVEPREDTNLDGTGDGTEITDSFQEFTNTVLVSGSSLVLRLVFSLQNGEEDISVDNIRLIGS